MLLIDAEKTSPGTTGKELDSSLNQPLLELALQDSTAFELPLPRTQLRKRYDRLSYYFTCSYPPKHA